MNRSKCKKVGLKILKCCLCDSELKNGKKLYKINKNIQIKQCPNCSTVFTFPPPYHETKDCLIYKDPSILHQCKNTINTDYARFLLQLIPKEKRLNKTVLDFGCGNGEALFLLKKSTIKF